MRWASVDTPGLVIEDTAQCQVGGVQYPKNWPKSDIAGLVPVEETDRPDDDEHIVTGDRIGVDVEHGRAFRVWEYTSRTREEIESIRMERLDSEKRNKINAIKQQAAAIILARYPIHAQANMSWDMHRLNIAARSRTLTDAENVRVGEFVAGVEWVEKVRAYSDHLEDLVHLADYSVELPVIDAGWPGHG